MLDGGHLAPLEMRDNFWHRRWCKMFIKVKSRMSTSRMAQVKGFRVESSSDHSCGDDSKACVQCLGFGVWGSRFRVYR